jgi:hypothetical protein
LTEFRNRILRVSVGLIALCSLAAMTQDVDLALGLGIGGAAGVAAFWMLSRRVEEFLGMDATEIQVAAMRGMFVRMAVYGLSLGAAYMLDPVTRRPLFAAILGLLIPRVVMYLYAFKSARAVKPPAAE